MVSSKYSSALTLAVVLLLLIFLSASTVAMSNPMPAARHHRARSDARTRMVACKSYLSDSLQFPPKAHLKKPLPSQACCSRYLQIFSSGDPTSLCLYMHPEKLKTSINVNRLLSLHDLCGGPVPLYDVCTGLDYPDGMFNGIEEVNRGNRIIRHRPTPFKTV